MTDLALAAANAAAAVLPSVDPLVAAGAQPGNENVTASFFGAAIAELDGAVTGRIAILVGEELTPALASSPIEGLDLAAAAQPALDAIAATLGASAKAARTVELDLVFSDLGPDFTVVPLIGAGIAASVLIQDHLLTEAPEASTGGDDGAQSQPSLVEPVETQAAATPEATNVTPLPVRGLEMLHGVDMEVTVELGRTRMTVRD